MLVCSSNTVLFETGRKTFREDGLKRRNKAHYTDNLDSIVEKGVPVTARSEKCEMGASWPIANKNSRYK